MKNTFFNLSRFTNLCRKNMVEDWRANLLRLLVLYGVMAVILVWYGYIVYHNYKSYSIQYTKTDPVWEFVALAFLWFLFGFGALSASFTMENMKSKASRLSSLMIPATSFEKYFSRWLVSTVVFLFLFLIAFKLADYTRVIIYRFSYPKIEAIEAFPLTGWVDRTSVHYVFVFRKMHMLIFIFALYLYVQSLFVLGSVIWPKNSFLKTFASGSIIAFLYFGTIILLIDMFSDPTLHYDTPLSLWTDAERSALFSVLAVLGALFNWVLGYFRFKESEIIQRM